MSASNKKKLRKEQEAALLTEKQRKEQAEAKKLKAYTVTFFVVMALVVCIAVGTIAYTNLTKTGIFHKNTVAATIGEHKLSTVDFNYFYVDEINSNYSEWMNSYGDYTQQLVMMMYSLDITQPLSYQYYDEENGITWADYFADLTLSNARTVYSIYDAAMAENYTLSEDAQAALDSNIQLMQDYADLFSDGDIDAYIEGIYGTGADIESYSEYARIRSVATAYQSDFLNSLVYDDAVVDAYNEAHYNDFTAYTFADKYISYTEFLHEGGEEPEEDHVHTDEEIDAARAAAKAASESLLGATTVEGFDARISGLDIFADETSSSVASEKVVDALLLEINEQLKGWVSDPARKEGDMTVIENYVTTTDDDGNEEEVLAGYYTLFFQSKDENLEPLSNVRHLLVTFEGGVTDETTGVTTYSDEEKNAAKEAAAELMETWKNGAATEESFIELVKEHTDDTASAETGGLFTDITPESEYVEPFLNWSIDPDREAGDVELVETEYGYHIMYYVGDSEQTYREYLIVQTLTAEDFTAWGDALIEATPMELGNIKFINSEYIIYGGSTY